MAIITNLCNGNFLISPATESAYKPAIAKPTARQTVTAYNSHSWPKQRCFISYKIP